MEIPAFAKSLPFLVGTGTVGVGGVGAAAAWGAGAFGGSSQSEAGPGQQTTLADTRIVSDPNSDVMQNMKYMGEVWELLFKEMKTSVEETFNHLKSTDKNSTSGDPSKWNDLFGLVNYGCTKKHLVGQMPNFQHDKAKENTVFTSDTNTATSLKVAAPTNISDLGEFSGCATMGWKSDKDKLIFKSEVVIRNQKYGMAFWTGIKTAEESSGSKTSLNVIHFVAFYERRAINKQMGWVVKGGYGWGGKKYGVSANSISIKLPWETQTHTISTSANSQGERHGVWSPEGKAHKLMELEQNWYSSKGSGMEFSPLKLKIGKTAHAFLNTEKNREDESDWYWNRYCTDGNDCWEEEEKEGNRYELDVKDQIEGWFQQFKDQEGTWASSGNPYTIQQAGG